MARDTYSWPAIDDRKVIGTSPVRLDGTPKASGQAKYASDLNPEGLLHAVLLTSPHAHARIKTLDVSPAKAMSGVMAIEVIAPAGTEIQWAHAEIVAVAATTEEIARDAVRAIRIEYEVLPHLVKDDDLKAAGDNAKPAGEKVQGDPDDAFKTAATVSEGFYGMPVITHCCLEPHGQVVQWKDDKILYWPSTQNVSGIGGTLAKSLEIPEANIEVEMQYIGGGFGSKFSADSWGIACAKLSKASGGRPVKLFLDRATELAVAGQRPSAYAQVKIAADREGNITAWESRSWASGGVGGGGQPPIPYVFIKIPHWRTDHYAVSVNGGGARAWRAPNHQQACLITCGAIDDLAAKMNMDPLDVFIRNTKLTAKGRPDRGDAPGDGDADVYAAQLRKAADLIGWKSKWKGRGKMGSGHLKTGLGISLHTWGGGGHRSESRCNIFPDGNVEIELGSQDLGTGTRTVIAQVVAEALGLGISDVRVKMGSNAYPASGASGGSTTVGGVCSSTYKAAIDALDELFAEVAPGLNTTPDKLVASNRRIEVKGDSSKGMSWRDACRKLGVRKITTNGLNDPRRPGGLNSSGAAGVQMAEVEVDTETGVVRMLKMVAVQDCGLIVNPKLAASQVYGSCIMSICGALMEERVLDIHSGRFLNAEMEFYKLAGIKDIGEIEVHMDIAPEHDSRGIIGLGEPPAVGGIAAISNAVANAIGVRVPTVPVTPDRVLAALQGRKA